MLWTQRGALAGLIVFSFSAPSTFADEKVSPASEHAQALVLQALDNEAAGDGAARDRLLKQALAVDPQYPAAHWHLGHVHAGGKWLPVASATAIGADGETAAQYAAKRKESLGSAAQELNLAQWCVKHDMPDRARLHYWQVLGNPRASEEQIKESARRLDLVSVAGKLIPREAFELERQRQSKISAALEKWSPVLNQLQPALDGPPASKRRTAAMEKLAAIDDPAVIAAAEMYAPRHEEGFGEELVKLLVKFPQHESTQSLVRFAVLTPYVVVRERAVTELKNRPLHDYVPTLLAGLVGPIESQFRITRDRRGNVRYEHAFVKEEADAKTVLFRREDIMRRSISTGTKGLLPGQIKLLAANYEEIAMQELELRVKEQQLLADAANRSFATVNAKVLKLLEQASGQQLPQKPQAWWQWWQDYNQIHYPKPTRYQFASKVSHYLYPASMSCFLAGTPVWTETGLRPIESIQPGDRVLSQDPDTGELAFKLVTGKTVRPPAAASTLNVLGESITTTLGHPLWVTGQGWEMAKHVKPGDQLHGVHGILVVSAIDPLPHKIEAHNLVVEGFGTYFVGNCGLLVHDNTYRQPTRAVVPGLTP